MKREFPVHVAQAFPGIDGSEVRRLRRRDEPLNDRQVGHTGQPDLAIAPLLRARPFDQIMAVSAFLVPPIRSVSFRLPGAPWIHIDDRVAARHPIKRIGSLEVSVFRIPLAFDAAFLEEIPVLEGPVFAVGAPGDECRNFFIPFGTRHVDIYFDAAAHRHGDIALDDHAMLVCNSIAEARVLMLGWWYSLAEDPRKRLFGHQLSIPLSINAERSYRS